MTQDVRWQQRFSNFRKALSRLSDAVGLSEQRELSELEKQGLINTFEFTHELAWKVLKDYFLLKGNNTIHGSRDAIREAFSNEIIEDGEGWMEMIDSRNRSTHTYDQKTADEISTKIVSRYFDLFLQFERKMLAFVE